MQGEIKHVIRKAQKGDRDAFEHLLCLYYDMIYRVAYRFTGHASDAEDIAQEISLALVDKLRSYRGRSSFSTWLYRLIVNHCLDFRKKQATDRARDRKYAELELMGTAEAHEANRKAAWLYRSVSLLSSPFKETALLVLAEELSHAEVAKILDCKESTVSWRMHEVRNHLTGQQEGYHA